METLTRGQMKGRAQMRARLGGQLEGVSDPFTLDQMLDETGDEYTRSANEAHLTVTTGIVSGQGTYCAPELYYIESADAILSDGTTLQQLSIVDSQDMLSLYPSWRTETPAASGDPAIFVTEGGNDGVLYPIPDYTQAAGLILRGFGLYARTLWPLDTDACPLPVREHAGIVLGLTAKLLENEGETPSELRRAAVYMARYRDAKGRFQAEAHTYHEARRTRRGDSNAERAPVGPLDL